MIEKSLRKSRPEFQPPPEEQAPEIDIEDSRTLEDAGAGPSFLVKKILIEGNTLIDDETLAPLVDVGEGLEVTLGILALMANEITAFYASEGYFLTRAYIPEQEVQNGTVVIQVVEGRLGDIEVTGNDRLDSEDLAGRMQRVREEDILREQTLERVLLELNDLLGVQVRSVLKPGELPGTSDLVLEVTETKPYQISFDGDNFGSRFTGENRFGVTAAAGSLLVFGDQFTVRGVRSDEGQNFIQPSYQFPINNYGTTLRGSFTFSEHELGENLVALRAGGSSILYTVEMSHPVHRSRTARISVTGGAEFRNFENEQLGKKTSDDKLRDVFFSVGGNFSDDLQGRTFFDVRLQFGYTESDPNRVLNSRAQGRGDVTLAIANAVRYQSLPLFNSYLVMKANGQTVSDRVLSPDQFAIGGVGSVRGFPLSEFAGDEGYNVSLEYVLPVPWALPLGFNNLTLERVFSLVGFIDHAKIFIRDRQPGEQDQSITGVGGGFRLNIPKVQSTDVAVSFALIYGIPALGSPDPSDGSFGTLYLSGLLTY